MFFFVVESGAQSKELAPNTARLIKDRWDDYFKFSTLFELSVCDANSVVHEIGEVKIGQVGMGEGKKAGDDQGNSQGYSMPGKRSPNIPNSFESLENDFFSVGQDDSYYERLSQLGELVRIAVLTALRDMAINSELYEQFESEPVTKISLLRSVSTVSLLGQYHRLANGGARLSKYRFDYALPTEHKFASTVIINFDITPESNPPSNIHVIIGRNGVGKTRLLERMSRAIRRVDGDIRNDGKFCDNNGEANFNLFSNLISVTFSAFDQFKPPSSSEMGSELIKYSYVGLKARQKVNDNVYPKTPEMLAGEFVTSVVACTKGARRLRWHKVLNVLESDSIFAESEVADLSTIEDEFDLKKQATRLFENCSSGHKIVLLTMARLVENVEERTLVLLDEPEAHLHPPLLSAFIRALSDLLIDRNGVAIIATHSPVILQEVPKKCVWKMRRAGAEVNIERPLQETFGENVGVLTSEVFGLEVAHSGFHSIIKKAVFKYRNYQQVVDSFDGELGAEAKAIIRAMIASI